MDTQDSPDRDDTNNVAITSKLNAALLVGQRSLRIQRCSVGIGCLSLGVASYVLYFMKDPAPHAKSDYDNTKSSTMCLCPLLYNFRFLAVGFAPLADDLRLTRLVVGLDIIFIIVDEALLFFFNRGSFWFDLRYGYHLSIAIVSCFFLIRVPHQREASVMQKDMWKVIAVNRLFDAMGQILACIWVATTLDYAALAYHGSWGAADFLLFFLIVNPYSLQRMSVWFRWMFEAQRGSKAASGIAGLIGDCSVSEALAQAKPRFRCIRMDLLCIEDFIDSPANPDVTVRRSLFERTQHCNLGSCDAFLSHSWHDDVRQKWDALQLWRAEFIIRCGREPWVWFDKACIDQQSVQEDLRGLPIFLGGSKDLVILCGPTYLSRLWCIVELFTFVHIKRDFDRITVLPVIRAAEARNDAAMVRRAYEHFDAQQCLCFSQGDKQRMLGIIMAAFGDMTNFNCAVRSLVGVAISKDSVLLGHVEEEEEGSVSMDSENDSNSDSEIETSPGNS